MEMKDEDEDEEGTYIKITIIYNNCYHVYFFYRGWR